MRYNSGFIGLDKTPTASSQSGIHTPVNQFLYQKLGLWRGPPVSLGTYTIVQTFTATSTWTCPAGVTEVEYLIVGGGAGGGGGIGGGGGAGGFRTGTGLTVTPTQDYTITVGALGTGWPNGSSANGPGNSGGSSSISGASPFSTITSAGGGAGGGALNAGTNGGSGGGAGGVASPNTGGTGNTPASSSPPDSNSAQGNTGGSGAGGVGIRGGGGGGGSSLIGTPAAGLGKNGTSSAGGNGGDGAASTITGSSVTYAGGGGGGADSAPVGTGGSSIGGNGGAGSGVAGANASPANRGSGGGGGGGSANGGNGSDGIVILKYTVPISPAEVVYTFKGTTTWKCPEGVTYVDYLVVAGGGGGGGVPNAYSGGTGGGAGGFRTGTGMTVSAGTDYTITVGGGGTAGASSSSSTSQGGDGQDSTFNTVTSKGGGGGGSYFASSGVGRDGGSGGGGTAPTGTGGSRLAITPVPGETTTVQGFNGGTGTSSALYGTGGGGGASAVGSNGTGSVGGNGGAGSLGPSFANGYGKSGDASSGAGNYFAGGGGGGIFSSPSASQGTGGIGGGGNANIAPTSGVAGATNVGGGGGGGAGTTPSGNTGGAGGSGIVIIKAYYAPEVDVSYEYNTLHLPGNGTNGAQNNTFLDSSTNNFTITRNGNTTQGTFSPFSQTGWGNYFGAASTKIATTSMTQLGSDFTLELWVYPQSFADYNTIFDSRTSDGDASGFVLGLTSAAKVYFYSNSSFLLTTTGTISANTWTHIALVRSGSGSGNVKIYINGVADVTTATYTTSFTRTAPSIGDDWNTRSNLQYYGYLSNLRATNGALYTSNFTPSTTPLTTSVSTGTVVLLTCQSNRFRDASASSLTITATGSPSVQAFSPFNPSVNWSAETYGGSGYFDGSGDWLTIAEATPLQLNSTAFSIELWLYPSSVSANRMIIGKRDTNGGSGYAFSWYIQGNSNGGFIFYSANGSLTSNNNVLIANAWNHIAVASDGTNVSMYANGSRVNTPTALAVGNSASSIYIGNFPVDNLYYQGNFANVRIQKGAQTYTGTTYTVPTAPLARDANTSLLLNFTNAGIYDATSKNDLETVGDAKISTAQSKWGGSSMLFDGTGDYLTNGNYSNPLLAFGTGDFTIEGWFYSNDASNSTQRGIFQTSDTAGGFKTTYTSGVIMSHASTAGEMTINIGGTSYTTSGASITTGAWFYFAITRSSGNVNVYINGTLRASGSGNTSNLTGTYIAVGGYYSTSYLFNGYLQDLRITKGIARYTANFTVPTAAFPIL